MDVNKITEAIEVVNERLVPKVEDEGFLEEDVMNLLDELIFDGRITRECTLTKRLKIKLQTLQVDELLQADSLTVASIEGIPGDVVARARAISTLVYATVSINNKKIIVDDVKETQSNRMALREKYMKLPLAVIERLHGHYLELLAEVNDKVLSSVGDNIENF